MTDFFLSEIQLEKIFWLHFYHIVKTKALDAISQVAVIAHQRRH